jgi:hypothetical protein
MAGGKYSISNKTEVVGISAVTKALKEIGELKNVNLARVTEACADELAARIKETLDSKLNPHTGNLRDSIRYYRSKKNKNFFWVGPDYRRGVGEGGGYHAHFFEHGTVERFVTMGLSKRVQTKLQQSGHKFASRGKIEPTKFAFIRPTYDIYGGKIMQDLVSGYIKEIEAKAKQLKLDVSR